MLLCCFGWKHFLLATQTGWIFKSGQQVNFCWTSLGSFSWTASTRQIGPSWVWSAHTLQVFCRTNFGFVSGNYWLQIFFLFPELSLVTKKPSCGSDKKQMRGFPISTSLTGRSLGELPEKMPDVLTREIDVNVAWPTKGDVFSPATQMGKIDKPNSVKSATTRQTLKHLVVQ